MAWRGARMYVPDGCYGRHTAGARTQRLVASPRPGRNRAQRAEQAAIHCLKPMPVGQRLQRSAERSKAERTALALPRTREEGCLGWLDRPAPPRPATPRIAPQRPQRIPLPSALDTLTPTPSPPRTPSPATPRHAVIEQRESLGENRTESALHAVSVSRCDLIIPHTTRPTLCNHDHLRLVPGPGQ